MNTGLVLRRDRRQCLSPPRARLENGGPHLMTQAEEQVLPVMDVEEDDGTSEERPRSHCGTSSTLSLHFLHGPSCL